MNKRDNLNVKHLWQFVIAAEWKELGDTVSGRIQC